MSIYSWHVHGPKHMTQLKFYFCHEDETRSVSSFINICNNL